MITVIREPDASDPTKLMSLPGAFAAWSVSVASDRRQRLLRNQYDGRSDHWWLIIGINWVSIWLITRWALPGVLEFGLAILAIHAVFAIERMTLHHTAARSQGFRSLAVGLSSVILAVGVAGSITDDRRFTNERVDYPWGTETFATATRSILGFDYEHQTALVGRAFAESEEETSVVIEQQERTLELLVRTGATCRDGWISSATGSGACSHHGGVREWRHRVNTRTYLEDVEVEVTITIPAPPPPPGLSECSGRVPCES